MPCKKDFRRVDKATGRAMRGSQRQIQILVNDRQKEFRERLLAVLSPPAPVEAMLRWVSPLAEDGFNEYQDAEFLQKLELSQHCATLKKFWPEGGPCWDALAIVEGPNTHGAVLIEAKSHISEMKSAWKAKAAASRALIEEALDLTAENLGVRRNPLWTEDYYQIANRYAHLYFLREVAKVPAWLVNVYFINDHSIDHVEPAPRSVDVWGEELARVKERMGLAARSIPYTSELYLEAVNTQ